MDQGSAENPASSDGTAFSVPSHAVYHGQSLKRKGLGSPLNCYRNTTRERRGVVPRPSRVRARARSCACAPARQFGNLDHAGSRSGRAPGVPTCAHETTASAQQADGDAVLLCGRAAACCSLLAVKKSSASLQQVGTTSTSAFSCLPNSKTL